MVYPFLPLNSFKFSCYCFTGINNRLFRRNKRLFFWCFAVLCLHSCLTEILIWIHQRILFKLKKFSKTPLKQRIKEGFYFAIKSVAAVFLHKKNLLAHLLQHVFLSLCVCLFLILLSWTLLLLHQRGLKLGLWGQEDVLRVGFQEIIVRMDGFKLEGGWIV